MDSHTLRFQHRNDQLSLAPSNATELHWFMKLLDVDTGQQCNAVIILLTSRVEVLMHICVPSSPYAYKGLRDMYCICMSIQVQACWKKMTDVT